jgi:nucleoside-diphosphate-sugar epimerase
MRNPLAADLNYVLERTEPLWEEVRGARLFVTGGTGFVGSWLLETFLWACERLALDAEMAVLCRNYAPFLHKAPHLATHPRLRFVEDDVRTFEFPEGEFSHIVHAAADSTLKLTPENSELIRGTIVRGTERALEFADQCDAAKFLFVSSGAVYGAQPPGVLRLEENHSCKPDTDYAKGKRDAEAMCKQARSLEAKIARCFAFVGPYLPLDAHFAAGNFVGDVLRGGPINVTGGGMARRSYLYAADLAIWLWTILFKGVAGRAYNVGSENDLSIHDLALVAAQTADPHIEVRLTQNAQLGKAAHRYVPSTVRARLELGLEDAFSIEEALTRTVCYHRRIADADSKLDGTLWQTFRSETQRSAKAGPAISSLNSESTTTAA